MLILAQEHGGEVSSLRLDLSLLDLTLLFLFFVWVIGIGFALKRAVKSSLDFFLSGRSLPAWVTGIGFISANIGAVELLGQSASGAQYGAAMVHYFWIGAIPAMVFLGIVMMPFYYGSKVRSVPEYLRLRFDPKAHLINAITFVVGSMLIAGVNLYALSIVLEALLGIPLIFAIILAAVFVLSYILLGGLTSAIYNEVMQFFVDAHRHGPADDHRDQGDRRPQHCSTQAERGAWEGVRGTVDGYRHRRVQPRGRLDRDHPWPGLLPVLRILDDEFRRSPARDGRQGRQLRPAHPDHRGLPQVVRAR